MVLLKNQSPERNLALREDIISYVNQLNHVNKCDIDYYNQDNNLIYFSRRAYVCNKNIKKINNWLMLIDLCAIIMQQLNQSLWLTTF